MRRLIALLLMLLPLPAAAQQIDVSIHTRADGTRTLVHEILVPAPADAVWQAVGTVEGWRTWATPLVRPVAGTDRFETSYKPDAAPGGPETIEHQWLTRQPPRSVSFRTTRTPAGFPHAEAYLRTTSTFTLLPDATGTRVTLTSDGYADDAAGDALVGFFREGNRLSLLQLHRRFTAGPLDWQAADPDR